MKPYSVIIMAMLLLIPTITRCGSNKHNEHAEQDSTVTVRAKETAQHENEGDTLCEYDGNTVIYKLLEDIQSLSFSEITTYAGNKTISKCKVKGYSNLVSADGKALTITVGVDTLRYNISSLHGTLDPIKNLAGKDTREYSLTYNFPTGDVTRRCSFNLTAHLPYERPEYINRIIAAIMHRDILSISGVEDIQSDIMEEYRQLGMNPNRYPGLNTSKVSPKEIGDYFAHKFEKAYKKLFDKEIREGWGPQEEYLLETSPVWRSDDGNIITYRFYTYHYGGGAHGMMNEFYLTFDNKDGRVLGYRDILGDEGMSKAIPVMNKKLDKRLINDTEVSGGHSSDLGKVGKDDYYDRMLNETFEGYVYPRAAITRNGIVFTYQPYDKGSFADGVLHILLNRP